MTMLANNREYVRGRGFPAETIKDRDERIIARYQAGARGQAIADEFGISRERVCQILRRVNIIEHVAERKRLAREQLASEAENIKAEARTALQAKIDAGLNLVREGHSIARAATQVGLHISGKAILAKAVKDSGIQLRHSRHQDFNPRRERVAQLLACGLSVAEILRQVRADGDPISPQWVYNNFPSVRGRRRATMVYPAVSLGSADQPLTFRRGPAPPVNPDAQWTDEKVALLCKHWLSGCTAQQCVDILGGEFTRNAIIGKVGRLRAAGQLFVEK